ncbi:helix-turn-helix domain-containing protein [Methylorubrum salsuginis]|uniref:Zn-dependent peptidase ImmA, M78 family n=1 Tax=Methylorubrum salsuginis TaxID=414703 RepID=A0A1I4FM92_9HYPH|nr:XRE family transcriptional regulator [Methylorubrum salsuginis]SFL19014.1 Zn-dependent peptidase ImmA, M78 family [Methylorubrum salsuginis]
MNQNHIGQRVKALREARGMKQDDLKDLLGLNSRQIVSQIESGARRLSAGELVILLKHFDTTLDRITNPFLLTGKSAFSWRQRNVAQDQLSAFEELAGEWIGAYRALSDLSSTRVSKLLPNTRLTYTNAYEDAAHVGETVARQLELGDKPAFDLSSVMESKLGILVLMVDAINGISGAACQLPELDAVLINRNESFARRNSDLAHEFFHLLTWNVMRPAHVESSIATWEDVPRAHRTPTADRNQRIEQLADHFASGLLLPSWSLDRIGKPSGDAAQWLTEAAKFLGVSSRNLKWRLINSKRCPELASVQEGDLIAAGRAQIDGPRSEEKPLLFSRPFMKTIAAAIEQGHLSGQRAAALLRMERSAIGDLCDAYGVQRPVELGGRCVVDVETTSA